MILLGLHAVAAAYALNFLIPLLPGPIGPMSLMLWGQAALIVIGSFVAHLGYWVERLLAKSSKQGHNERTLGK